MQNMPKVKKQIGSKYQKLLVLISIVLGLLSVLFASVAYNQTRTSQMVYDALGLMAVGLLLYFASNLRLEPDVKYVTFAMSLVIITVITSIPLSSNNTKIIIDSNYIGQIDAALVVASSILFTFGEHYNSAKSRSNKNYFAYASFATMAFAILSLESLTNSSSNAIVATNFAIFLAYLSFGLVLARYENHKR
jgi:hypothetical protein